MSRMGTNLGFADFVDLLVKIAHAKFRKVPLLNQRIIRLFKSHIFPQNADTEIDSHDFRQQLAMSSAEYIFERHNTWLNSTFRAYSHDETDKNPKQPVLNMCLEDFKKFVTDGEMIEKKQLSYRTVQQLFEQVQMEGAGRDLYADGSRIVYWEFLEGIAALTCFAFKNPYIPLEARIDDFIMMLQKCVDIKKKRQMYIFYAKNNDNLTVI